MSEVWCANSAVSVAFQFSDVYGNAIGVCRGRSMTDDGGKSSVIEMGVVSYQQRAMTVETLAVCVGCDKCYDGLGVRFCVGSS